MHKSATKADLDTMKTEILNEVTQQLGTHQSMMKIREKSIFNAIESLSTAQTLMEKQFNLRVGSIKGNLNRQPKRENDDILAEFETFEDFQTWLDARNHNIDKRSKEVDLPNEPDAIEELLTE